MYYRQMRVAGSR